jgi:endo-alpha-1,4-polygalactosaminidase (GH114 family)
MKHLCFYFIFITLVGCTSKPEWICYYGSNSDIAPFKNVPLIVLASETNININKLVLNKQIVLGYLSIGELNPTQDDYEKLKKNLHFLEENKAWKSQMIDIRSSLWKDYLLNIAIPKLVSKGFNGLFLDTLDGPIYLEQKEPIKNIGMTKNLVQIIKEIHQKFPRLYIMANRGIEAASDYAPYVNSILAESFFTDYNFTTLKYELKNQVLVKEYLAILDNVKKNYPIKIYSLDYWNPKDKKGIAYIYKEQYKRNFIPYVATINLDEIIEK